MRRCSLEAVVSGGSQSEPFWGLPGSVLSFILISRWGCVIFSMKKRSPCGNRPHQPHVTSREVRSHLILVETRIKFHLRECGGPRGVFSIPFLHLFFRLFHSTTR